jgi:hypothetical protein
VRHGAGLPERGGERPADQADAEDGSLRGFRKRPRTG